VEGERVVGYDSFEGKDDHRHYHGKEHPYLFESLEKLWRNFRQDVEASREDKS
jgi:hypothetical protein